jgi:hypothetical protein
MTDATPTSKSQAAAEIFSIIAMSVASGVFLMSAVSYFARGGGPEAWTGAAVAIFMLATALFLARRLFHKIT